MKIEKLHKDMKLAMINGDKTRKQVLATFIDNAKKAMENVGVQPIIVPIRGGTDGAQLTYRGLVCPNLCTGGENFHSRFEFISCTVMEKISDILVRIIKNAAEV